MGILISFIVQYAVLFFVNSCKLIDTLFLQTVKPITEKHLPLICLKAKLIDVSLEN